MGSYVHVKYIWPYLPAMVARAAAHPEHIPECWRVEHSSGPKGSHMAGHHSTVGSVDSLDEVPHDRGREGGDFSEGVPLLCRSVTQGQGCDQPLMVTPEEELP